MTDLRAAVRRLLQARPRANVASDNAGAVTRAVLDVTVQGRTEVVTLSLEPGGELRVATTAQAPDAFIDAALEAFVGDDVEPGSTTSPGLRSSPGEVTTGTDLRRVSTPSPDPFAEEGPESNRLAEALRDVVVAVVRAGTEEARRAPAVQEALEEVIGAAGGAAPLGLARWVGMLKNALAAEDVDRCAWLLDGAGRFAEALERGQADPVSRRRRVGWLGAVNPRERTRVSDRTLVEVGREVLSGLERRSLERRYLVCLSSGEVFREERFVRSAPLSVGPCPRLVSVGLADVEDGVHPKRIRLQQYAVASEPSRDQWSALGDVSTRSFVGLAESYREARLRFAGISEPFALLAPAEVLATDDALALVDAQEHPLPIARSADPSVADAMLEFLAGERPAWAAGRLIDAQGALMFVPVTVAKGEPSRPQVLRLA